MSRINITHDVIIVGGGHNGLTAAAYLARAKLKVLVLEARDVLGGMAATEEVWPGYRISRCAHLYLGLHPRIVRDLGLYKHGLKLTERRMPTVAIGNDGEVLPLSLDKWASRAALAGFSSNDGKAFEHFLKDASAIGALARAAGEAPARTAPWETLTLRALNRVDETEAANAAALAFASAADVLAARFETPLLQGALALEAGLGGIGPYDGAGLAGWALRYAGELSGVSMALGHPEGGMGSVAKALAAAARDAGAEVRTGARVEELITEGGNVIGVCLTDGEEIGARATISALAPNVTLDKLVPASEIEPDLAVAASHHQHGTIGKLNLALKGLPNFRGLEDEHLLKGRIVIAPSVEHLQHAWSDARAGVCTRDPAFEITIPTTHDGTLAPEGAHILSANVLHMPFTPTGGWEEHKEKYLTRLLSALNYYAPGLKDLVEHAELLTPADIEHEYGAPGGHWHHVPLSYDKVGVLRQPARAGDGGIALAGLYFASAGTHPGGGVTGQPGMLCAQAVIEDFEAT